MRSHRLPPKSTGFRQVSLAFTLILALLLALPALAQNEPDANGNRILLPLVGGGQGNDLPAQAISPEEADADQTTEPGEAGNQVFLPLVAGGEATDLLVQTAAGGGAGSVSLITLGSAYTQDFNTLANTGTTNNLTINGWYLNETGSSSANNGQYNTGTGSGTGGDVYSFGAAASTERALGTLFSGTLTPAIGAQFTNNTGSTVTSLDVSYIGEMWRAGVTNRNAADRLDFQLSTDATSLTTGTWVDYNSLDFNSPNINATAGALNGNSSPKPNPREFFNHRFEHSEWRLLLDSLDGFDIAPGADDGLAVDSFSFTPRVGDLAPEVVDTFPDNGATDFPINANLMVTFSEPVNVTPSWFTLVC